MVLPAVRRRPRLDRRACPPRPSGICRRPTAANPLAPKLPHFAPKAKRVIYLFMAGAPSHLELFDYKPQLAKFDGTLPPPELLKGYRAAFINPNSKLLGPRFKFARHGKSGAELSELLPHTAAVADDIAIVKSMQTDAFNHAPAQILMNTGSPQFGRPSIGAWATYGLGSESENLPGVRRVFSRGARARAAGIRTGGAASCRPSTRASRSDRGRPRPLPLQPARASTTASSATRSTRSAASTGCASTPSATPRSPPGSAASRWPTGCSRAPPR